MRRPIISLVLFLWVPAPDASAGRCLDRRDPAAIVAARAAVAAACDCEQATSRGHYLRCAATVANDLVATGDVAAHVPAGAHGLRRQVDVREARFQ